MRLSVVYLLLAGIYNVGDSIRAEDVDASGVNVESGDDCQDAVQALLLDTTYRNLFSPIKDGKYQLQHIESGSYLQSHGVFVTSGQSDPKLSWTLARVPRNRHTSTMQNYTLRVTNGASLVASHDLAAMSFSANSVSQSSDHWVLQVGPRGQSFALQHVDTSKFLSMELGAATLVESAVQWKLISASRDFRIFNRRQRDLRYQWDVVKDIPLLPGVSDMLWKHTCTGDDACLKWYDSERKRLSAVGRIDETKKNMIDENVVRGMCDRSAEGMRTWVHQPTVLRELMAGVKGNGCPASLTEFSKVAALALEKGCFGSCSSGLSSHLGISGPAAETIQCSNYHSANWTAIFEVIVEQSDSCAEMPFDSLTILSEYVMQTRCNVWYPEYLLWVPQDTSPADLGADVEQVCTIAQYDMKTRDPSHLIAKGTCPEGSYCGCPKLYRSRPDMIGEIRKSTLTTFVPSFAALAPSLVKQAQKGLLISVKTAAVFTLLTAITSGFSAGVSGVVSKFITALPGVFTKFMTLNALSAQIVLFYSSFTTQADKWTCAKSAGCWPLKPTRKTTQKSKSACRYPNAPSTGSSEFWYMPPPMLKYSRKLVKCRLMACSQDDIDNQKVGFGRDSRTFGRLADPNVYNCQPLTFEQMTVTQQEAFTQNLFCTGVLDEYPLKEGRSVPNVTSCT